MHFCIIQHFWYIWKFNIARVGEKVYASTKVDREPDVFIHVQVVPTQFNPMALDPLHLLAYIVGSFVTSTIYQVLHVLNISTPILHTASCAHVDTFPTAECAFAFEASHLPRCIHTSLHSERSVVGQPLVCRKPHFDH
jgi:hypothetical protein